MKQRTRAPWLLAAARGEVHGSPPVCASGADTGVDRRPAARMCPSAMDGAQKLPQRVVYKGPFACGDVMRVCVCGLDRCCGGIVAAPAGCIRCQWVERRRRVKFVKSPAALGPAGPRAVALCIGRGRTRSHARPHRPHTINQSAATAHCAAAGRRHPHHTGARGRRRQRRRRRRPAGPEASASASAPARPFLGGGEKTARPPHNLNPSLLTADSLPCSTCASACRRLTWWSWRCISSWGVWGGRRGRELVHTCASGCVCVSVCLRVCCLGGESRRGAAKGQRACRKRRPAAAPCSLARPARPAGGGRASRRRAARPASAHAPARPGAGAACAHPHRDGAVLQLVEPRRDLVEVAVLLARLRLDRRGLLAVPGLRQPRHADGRVLRRRRRRPAGGGVGLAAAALLLRRRRRAGGGGGGAAARRREARRRLRAAGGEGGRGGGCWQASRANPPNRPSAVGIMTSPACSRLAPTQHRFIARRSTLVRHTHAHAHTRTHTHARTQEHTTQSPPPRPRRQAPTPAPHPLRQLRSSLSRSGSVHDAQQKPTQQHMRM
jgi:hypothetical protein